MVLRARTVRAPSGPTPSPPPSPAAGPAPRRPDCSGGTLGPCPCSKSCHRPVRRCRRSRLVEGRGPGPAWPAGPARVGPPGRHRSRPRRAAVGAGDAPGMPSGPFPSPAFRGRDPSSLMWEEGDRRRRKFAGGWSGVVRDLPEPTTPTTTLGPILGTDLPAGAGRAGWSRGEDHSLRRTRRAGVDYAPRGSYPHAGQGALGQYLGGGGDPTGGTRSIPKLGMM